MEKKESSICREARVCLVHALQPEQSRHDKSNPNANLELIAIVKHCVVGSEADDGMQGSQRNNLSNRAQLIFFHALDISFQAKFLAKTFG
jgi:hypothetical protein